MLTVGALPLILYFEGSMFIKVFETSRSFQKDVAFHKRMVRLLKPVLPWAAVMAVIGGLVFGVSAIAFNR